MPGPSRPLSALLLVALLGLLVPGVARAASPAPTASAAPSAEALQAEAERRAVELLDARADGAVAATAASAALEAYAVAQVAADSATVALRTAQAARDEADGAVRTARTGLGTWAADLYRTGAADPQVALLDDLLGASDPQGVLLGLGSVQQATDGKQDALAALRTALAARAVAAVKAQAAAEQAEAAATTAARDRALADAVVAESARRLAAAEQGLATAQQALAAQRERDAVAARWQAAQQASARLLSAHAGAAACTLPDVTGFANGQLAAAALCSLPSAPGHRLRAPAAASFVRLDAAFAEAFGRPLCVTDSYRDLAGQVAVRAAKPHLAAVPGTSNHGWGAAVDLCGGVERFGTPEHVWLQEHALAFGWFHPAWAQQDGSKPEPWHWEHAG